jgi:hypothetical protein
MPLAERRLAGGANHALPPILQESCFCLIGVFLQTKNDEMTVILAANNKRVSNPY